MQLINVTDDMVRTDLIVDHKLVISHVKERALYVSSIMDASDATVDPTLQKEMNFMKNWLVKAVEVEVPFSPYIKVSEEENEQGYLSNSFLGSLSIV